MKLVRVTEYTRADDGRVVVGVRVDTGASRLREAARIVAEDLMDLHYERVLGVLTRLAERCMAELLASEARRRWLAREVLREFAQDGIVELRCRGDECRAVIDVDETPEPSDWESKQSVEESIVDSLPEFEAFNSFLRKVEDCVMRKLRGVEA